MLSAKNSGHFVQEEYELTHYLLMMPHGDIA